MGLRGFFKRDQRPSTEGLQKADQKNKKTKEIVLPPRDDKGRFIPDRSKNNVKKSSGGSTTKNNKEAKPPRRSSSNKPSQKSTTQKNKPAPKSKKKY